MLAYQIFQHRPQFDRFIVQTEVLPLFHTHGKDLLHQSAELFQLGLDNLKIVLSFCQILCSVEVQQRIVGGVGYGYRSFQFVSNVMCEVLFHFFYAFLP